MAPSHTSQKESAYIGGYRVGCGRNNCKLTTPISHAHPGHFNSAEDRWGYHGYSLLMRRAPYWLIIGTPRLPYPSGGHSRRGNRISYMRVKAPYPFPWVPGRCGRAPGEINNPGDNGRGRAMGDKGPKPRIGYPYPYIPLPRYFSTHLFKGPISLPSPVSINHYSGRYGKVGKVCKLKTLQVRIGKENRIKRYIKLKDNYLQSALRQREWEDW